MRNICICMYVYAMYANKPTNQTNQPTNQSRAEEENNDDVERVRGVQAHAPLCSGMECLRKGKPLTPMVGLEERVGL